MEQLWFKEKEFKGVVVAAAIFFSLTLFFSLHRYYSFYANTDHGLFNQVFWNSIHGNLFESSLSSSLSNEVIHEGGFPELNYRRLGQHFTPALLLWLPFYALFPFPSTLNVLQVTLMTGGGLMLYALAKSYVNPVLAARIAISYYAANTVIGPTLGNFFDLCQLPLFAFGLLLAHKKQCWWLFWLLACLILAVREDTGVVLFSLGFYWLCSRKFRLGLGMCLLSLTYMLVVTNAIMPLFSEDISKRFMIERFGHFVEDEEASTLEIISAFILNPGLLLRELFTPFVNKLRYLLSHWLPLAFVPALSPAAWLSTVFPFTQIFLQQGRTALSINIRYAVALIPGVFYGAIIWWSGNQHRFTAKIRNFWSICLGLSLFFTFTSNPHRAWFFLIPDSIQPLAYRPLTVQWQHVHQLRHLIAQIPADASLSASRYLTPNVSSRRAFLRYPDHILYRDDRGQVQGVEYILVDLWRLNLKGERRAISNSVPRLDRLIENQEYGVIGFKDWAVLLKKNTPSDAQAMIAWLDFRQTIEPSLQQLHNN